ncbi:MAG: SCO family protein [Aquificae bacterium]|nr:SCO family protein [Aquificota bacterium]
MAPLLFITLLLGYKLWEDSSKLEKNPFEEYYLLYKIHTEHAYDPSGVYIPSFPVPEPGTYQLPHIKEVKNHILLNEEGKPVRLYNLKKNKVAVVSFIYTNCPDKYGCNLSTFILSQLDKALSKSPELKNKVVIITVSFDPERDTPPRLKRFRELLNPSSDWRFLTASSEKDVEPVLNDFGQRVQKLYYEDGRWTGIYRHVLKIFLLDEQNYVRNIYSSGMVNTALIISDIKTLLNDPPHHTQE